MLKQISFIIILFVQTILAQDGATLLTLMGDASTPVFCEGNLILDGQFNTWVGDNPDPNGWAVIGEDAGDYVTENPAGVCEIHVDDGATIMTSKNPYVLEIGVQYDYSFDVLEYSGTRVNVNIGGDWVEGGNQLTTGTYTGTITASTTVAVTIATWSGVAMMQIDNLCITPH